MVLSDKHLKEALADGSLQVTPLEEKDIQPASIDLHLDPLFRRFKMLDIIDLSAVPQEHTELFEAKPGKKILVLPGECVLMSTSEVVTLGDSLAAQVDGKSSLGRLFQSVHITAGWIDPGFSGQITLEVVNHSPSAMIYHPGMPIAQLVVINTSSPVDRPYSSIGRYQKQVGPVESRYTYTPQF